MNWTEAEIYTSTEGADIICASLLDIGIKGFSIKDSEDFNEFLKNKDGKWDYIDDDLMSMKNCETSVTVYLPDNTQGGEMLISLKNILRLLKSRDTQNKWGRLEVKLKSVKEEDWANNWKQYFKPLKIGNKLLIKPSWEDYDESDNRIVPEIDPRQALVPDNIILLSCVLSCWKIQ